MNFGINLDYCAKKNQKKHAQAFIIAEKWIDSSPVVLLLGDNLFFGNKLEMTIKNAIEKNSGATIFVRKLKTLKDLVLLR